MAIQEFILRFLRNGMATDIQITENSMGYNRLHTKEDSVCVPLLASHLSLSHIPPNNVGWLYNQMVPNGVSGWYVHGFNIRGQTDGEISLFLNGAYAGGGTISGIHKRSCVRMDPPLYVSEGQAVQLQAENIGLQIADFSGVIYVEPDTGP